jgi:hypothetical protein
MISTVSTFGARAAFTAGLFAHFVEAISVVLVSDFIERQALTAQGGTRALHLKCIVVQGRVATRPYGAYTLCRMSRTVSNYPPK